MKTIVKLIMLLFLSACAQKTDPKNNLTTKDEWKDKLTPEQYYILREKGTEKPFSGKYVFTKDKGTYHCAGCGTALFTDDMKFDSHCGWPSFDKEIMGGKIKQTDDYRAGMHRIEITCAQCGGHLGHLFDDGPTETGKRYCVNSLALSFEPSMEITKNEQKIIVAGGCFWCTEAIFEKLKGVSSVISGYTGGQTSNPTYEEVCTGKTGHAEAIEISYDANLIHLQEILEVFFSLHNPTTLNQQGADIGTQYRSAIFYENDVQKNIANQYITKLKKQKKYKQPIVTEVTKATIFYKAENYHQDYFQKNKSLPYCKMVIAPKTEKLKELFPTKIKTLP